MSPQFVDTNVLLHAYDASDARHGAALALVSELGRSKQGVLSLQVLQEFYVNVTRKIARPLTSAQAIRRLEILSRWRVHCPLPTDAAAAARLAERHQLSYWDASILRSAAAMGCDVLWTEDLNHGQVIGPVTIQNPFK